jgi:hypothetical protein
VLSGPKGPPGVVRARSLEHRVEGRGLVVDRLLAGRVAGPGRRADRPRANPVLGLETPVGAAVGHHRIRIELQLLERMPQEAVGVLHWPPEPERGSHRIDVEVCSLLGSSKVQVRFLAEPGTSETRISSGSSCPEHPAE